MTFLLIVTVSSMLLAAVMSVIAWRISAEERNRSAARVAALAAEIRAPAAAAPRAAAQAAGARVKTFPSQRPLHERVPSQSRTQGQQPQRWNDADLPLHTEGPVARGPIMFSAEPSRSSGRGVLAVVGVLIVGGAFAFALVSSRSAAPAEPAKTPAAEAETATRHAPAPAPAPPVTAPAAAVPLELVALGHDRDGDRLTVRGVVRNPPSGRPLERLAVVVFAFRADGGFLASNRAIIELSALNPGGEASFLVAVPDAAGVGRYRVSFRSDDRVVPHVDTRETPK
jgi:hypothetical protein